MHAIKLAYGKEAANPNQIYQALSNLVGFWKRVMSPKLLGIDWMDGMPAPQAVMELLACKCPRGCTKQPDCQCMANGLFCTDMCKHNSAKCKNLRPEEIDFSLDDIEDDISDDNDML